MAASVLRAEFCDQWWELPTDRRFLIGREGDIALDDNEYLHRAFLELWWEDFWWIANVGGRLGATLSDSNGTMQTWMAPASRLPLLFATTEVRFTAGPTSYQLCLHLEQAPMATSGTIIRSSGTTTMQPAILTDRQRAVVLALAEPALLANDRAPSTIPSSAEAAHRLGWKLTTFNRQLDAVCQKLARTGARGLHGDSSRLASSRRARLVEHALATRLVTVEDLPEIQRMRQQAEQEP